MSRRRQALKSKPRYPKAARTGIPDKPMDDICERTGKRGFRKKKDVFRTTSHQLARVGKQVRAYKCGFCGFWHATTAPQKT